MTEYRRKALYVDAIQLTDTNAAEVVAACAGRGRLVVEIDSFDENKKIETVNVMFLEGGQRMQIGEWLVQIDEVDFRIFSDREFRENFEETDA